MSTVKEKEETKIIWSKKEKDTSKETYGCEIVIENGKPSDVRTNEAPTDCFIVTYEFNGDTHQDLTEHTRTQKEKAKVVTKIVEKKSRQKFDL